MLPALTYRAEVQRGIYTRRMVGVATIDALLPYIAQHQGKVGAVERAAIIIPNTLV